MDTRRTAQCERGACLARRQGFEGERARAVREPSSKSRGTIGGTRQNKENLVRMKIMGVKYCVQARRALLVYTVMVRAVNKNPYNGLSQNSYFIQDESRI